MSCCSGFSDCSYAILTARPLARSPSVDQCGNRYQDGGSGRLVAVTGTVRQSAATAALIVVCDFHCEAGRKRLLDSGRGLLFEDSLRFDWLKRLKRDSCVGKPSFCRKRCAVHGAPGEI